MHSCNVVPVNSMQHSISISALCYNCWPMINLIHCILIQTYWSCHMDASSNLMSLRLFYGERYERGLRVAGAAEMRFNLELTKCY